MIVEVPHRRLAAETLQKLIEEFVTRDGTDYGEQEASLERKVEDVRRQLERGEAVVLFDSESGSTHVSPKARGATGAGGGE
ncbi:MAG TPA: hypothetical protein DFS52_10620 [Myxococcales bacterium]|nr:hypothetical protein [Myxococcales bacterium]